MAQAREQASNSPKFPLPRLAYQYLVRYDIPELLEGAAELLVVNKPEEPEEALIHYLQSRKAFRSAFGARVGGVLTHGTALSGRWFCSFTSAGDTCGYAHSIPCAVNRSEVGGREQLVVALANHGLVFVACLPDTARTSLTETAVRRYDLFSGNLKSTWSFERDDEISCLLADDGTPGSSQFPVIWIFFAVSGAIVVNYTSGAVQRSVPQLTGVIRALITRDCGLQVAGVAACRCPEMRNQASLWVLRGDEVQRWDRVKCIPLCSIPLRGALRAPFTAFTRTPKHLWIACAVSDEFSHNCLVVDLQTGKVAEHIVAPIGSVVSGDMIRGGSWHLRCKCSIEEDEYGYQQHSWGHKKPLKDYYIYPSLNCPKRYKMVPLVFLNDRGCEVFSLPIVLYPLQEGMSLMTRPAIAALAGDAVTGLLWVYLWMPHSNTEAGFNDVERKIVLYDPLQCRVVRELTVNVGLDCHNLHIEPI